MSGKLEFIKPKNKQVEPVDWHISERTRAIVRYYAEYCEYSEQEIVDEFLQRNLLKDKQFLEWVQSRRNNKRILKAIGLSQHEE
ncbi:hypothetical protein [Ectobacillus panaciterrae]|uniref:hypothetical protein n=1 Tax=Ectobacillus panaciterrae TaxID=363872 RepID=UPI00041859BB|nr:hypothetical protein [Ectobacillus panaciterrae]